MAKIDLHIHTTYSDGTYTPEEVVRKAKDLDLVAISITDHDSVDGLEEAMRMAETLEMEVVPGIEMSTDLGTDEIHILGYYLDWKDGAFLSKLRGFQKARATRNRKLVERLGDLGMGLDYDEVKKMNPRGVISRLHIAILMVKSGYVRSIGAAFEQWLNPGKPAYVSRLKASPFQMIRLISDLGGIPVFGHPHLSRRDDLIPEFIKAGLRGVEVYHSTHNGRIMEHYKSIAQRYNLLVTGGSDCHGEAKDEVLMGKMKVPASLLVELKKVRDKAGRS